MSDIFRAGQRPGFPVQANGSYVVDCPACRAKPGQRCTLAKPNLSGSLRRAKPHTDRIIAWKAGNP